MFGFYDEENDINLIYPKLLHKAIVNFYDEQGIIFPWSETRMCRELLNEKYLYRTDKQDRPRIRRNNAKTKREESFLGVPQSKIHIACRYLEQGYILTK